MIDRALEKELTEIVERFNKNIKLEKYEQAWDVICSGIQIDPQSTPLRNIERSIDNLYVRRSCAKPQRIEDYEFTVCLKLLYEPITTSWGYSFCCSCLFQSMDRGNCCPLCRTVLFISPTTCSIRLSLSPQKQCAAECLSASHSFGTVFRLSSNDLQGTKFGRENDPPPLHPNDSLGKSFVDLLLKPAEEDLNCWPHGFEFRL